MFNPVLVGQSIVLLALTQAQLAAHSADHAGLSTTDAKREAAMLEHVVLDQHGDMQKTRIGGPIQLSRSASSGAEEAHQPEPASEEQITIAAKP